MPGIKANNTARARIAKTCGILKSKKILSRELLRQRAQKGPLCLPPPINTEKIVGLAAGRIYECLKKSGPMPLTMLRQNTGLVDYPFYEAMGWLDREKKIIVRGDPDQPQYAELCREDSEAL